MRVLLVEDDARLAESLVQILEDSGYGVDAVQDGAEGLRYAELGTYDAVVLDVMLPGMDGLRVAAEMRRRQDATPILMLTARSAVADRVAGLDAGADDYLTKPFAPAELLARLRAMTRRRGEVVLQSIGFGDLSLDLEGHDLACGGESIHLSLKEFLLMRHLMENGARVSSKQALTESAWGAWSEGTSNSLEAHISFLRKKIRFLGSKVLIDSIPKTGYRLAEGAA